MSLCLHFNYIILSDKNWTSVSNKINKMQLIELLNTFKINNDELLQKKHKDVGLVEAVNAIKVSSILHYYFYL